MITLSRMKDYVLQLAAKGALTAADNLDAKQIPINGFIVAVNVQCGVIGVDGTGSPTQDITVDIKKNGTSIVGATKITFTHATLGVKPSSYGTLVGLAPVAVAVGDVITLQGVQILNGTTPTQPLNLTATLRISRAINGLPGAILTGVLSPALP